MASDRDIRADNIDYVARRSGMGSLSDAFTGVFYGDNVGLTGNPIPYNTEGRGLVFFVRPRCNLSYPNLSMDRKMMTLATTDPYTISSAIRAYLDPVGDFERRNRGGGNTSSALVDPYYAFIPLMSNLLLNLNGWPDKTVGTFTSKPGIYRETWSMVDDISEKFDHYELSANWRNIKGDPITSLLAHWVDYASHVYVGKMDPYITSVTENEIDYVSRIYRVVLDETQQYVQKIMATGYCYPIAAPIGASANYNAETPFNTEVDRQVSASFACQGFIWNDPLLIYNFNRTVAMFNPHMRVSNLRSRSSLMVRLQPAERELLKGFGVYPRIEPRTFEMHWYAFRATYDALVNQPLSDVIPLPAFGSNAPLPIEMIEPRSS